MHKGPYFQCQESGEISEDRTSLTRKSEASVCSPHVVVWLVGFFFPVKDPSGDQLCVSDFLPSYPSHYVPAAFHPPCPITPSYVNLGHSFSFPKTSAFFSLRIRLKNTKHGICGFLPTFLQGKRKGREYTVRNRCALCTPK